MPSKIVISRRIYLPALIVAALLIGLVIGSIGVGAQGLCEYVTYTTVCIKGDGSMRVVGNPVECKESKEVPAFLANQQVLECLLGYEVQARMGADDELWRAIEALQPSAP